MIYLEEVPRVGNVLCGGNMFISDLVVRGWRLEVGDGGGGIRWFGGAGLVVVVMLYGLKIKLWMGVGIKLMTVLYTELFEFVPGC